MYFSSFPFPLLALTRLVEINGKAHVCPNLFGEFLRLGNGRELVLRRCHLALGWQMFLDSTFAIGNAVEPL